MEDRYVLILGAGLMQRPSLEAAMSLGYKTLVVDANPRAVCVPFADRFEPVDLKDREALLSLAKSMGSSLAAVFTAGTDFSASVSYVAENCSLPSHSFQAALNASDKTLMRGCFRDAGVPSPNFTQISRTEIASFISSERFDAVPFPCVVKPVDNMGARGCRMIRKKEEFLPAVEEAVRASRTGRAILEEYMRGEEYSIDAVVYDGTLTITGFADRHIFYEPYFIEMGHTMPTGAPEQRKLELAACFARAVSALGLSCGVAKADIKYTDKGPMIGEVAARLSGGYMSGWTYPYASSVNLTKQALLVALGKAPEELLQRRKPLAVHDTELGVYEVPCRQVSAERAWVSIPGTVRSVTGRDEARSVPFVQDVFFRAGEGDSVQFPRNNVEKCGNAISRAPDRSLAVQAAERSVSRMVLRLSAPCRETETFLSGRTEKSESGFPPSFFVIDAESVSALSRFLKDAPPLEPDKPVLPQLPDALKASACSVRDPNCRTIAETLALFDSLCPGHPALPAKRFWLSLLRGGLQGLLYVSDDETAREHARSASRRRRK